MKLVFHLRRQLQRVPIIISVWYYYGVEIVVFLSIVYGQIVQHKVNKIDPLQFQSSDEFLAVVTHWTDEHVESVAAVQRIRQAANAFLVKPLLAASTLQHLRVPLAVQSTVTINLFGVYTVMRVPAQHLGLTLKMLFYIFWWFEKQGKSSQLKLTLNYWKSLNRAIRYIWLLRDVY